jgi:hypothetical protein
VADGDDGGGFLPVSGGGAGSAVNGITTSQIVDFRAGVLGIVVGWVVKNVFITPAGWLFSLLGTVVNTVTGSIGGLRGPLSTVGGALRRGIIGPFDTLREQLVVAIGQAGVGAPVAAALVNVLLAGMLLLAVYLVARVFAAPAGGFA